MSEYKLELTRELKCAIHNLPAVLVFSVTDRGSKFYLHQYISIHCRDDLVKVDFEEVKQLILEEILKES